MRDDKDFRDACMVARLRVRKEGEALEEAIHRARLLMAASPEEVEQVFRHRQEAYERHHTRVV